MSTLSPATKNVLFYLFVSLLTCTCLFMVWKINDSLTADMGLSEVREETFSDVPRDALYAKAIFEMKKQGILQGYPDNTFKPEKVATRVEALKMLMESSALERSDILPSYERYIQTEKLGDFIVFNDIPKDAWYAPYILKASRMNMISGNPDGTFIATKPVNFSEFLKMMLILERDSISEEDAKESPFIGIETFQWYTPYFVRAKALGLLPLHGEQEMNPSEELTRGKIAMLLYNARMLRVKSADKFNGASQVQETDRMRSYLEDVTSGSGEKIQ